MDLLVAIVFALAAFGAYSLITWGRARAKKLVAEARLIEAQTRDLEMAFIKETERIADSHPFYKHFQEIRNKIVAKLTKL